MRGNTQKLTTPGRQCPLPPPGKAGTASPKKNLVSTVPTWSQDPLASFRYSDTVLSKGLRVKQMLIGLLIKPSLVCTPKFRCSFFIGEAVNTRGILRQHRSDVSILNCLQADLSSLVMLAHPGH